MLCTSSSQRQPAVPTSDQSPRQVIDGLLAKAFAESTGRTARSIEYVEGARAALLQRLIGKPFSCPHREGTTEADAFFSGADEGRRLHVDHCAIAGSGSAGTAAQTTCPSLDLIEQCADRAMAHRPQVEIPFFFTALFGHALCNEGAEVGAKLLDLIDATTLQAVSSVTDLADQILSAASMTKERRGEEFWAHYFLGHLQEIMNMAGRPDVAEAIGAMASSRGVSA